MTPIVNSYFAGAGLADLGLSLGGCIVQQSFELDAAACATLRLNFSHQIVQCDITQKLVEHELPADVMVAGYPCTRYSTIGDVHGVRTGDELFLHFFRHLAIRRPEIYVVENVPGMLKFPVVMEAMTALPSYYVTVLCPVKATTWLPQQRDRLLIIGSKRPFSWRAPVCARPVRLADIVEREPEVRIPKYVYSRLSAKYRDQPIISDPAAGDIAPTCVAHYAKDRSTRLVRDRRFKKGVRPYTVKEWARLQGVPDSFRFSGGEFHAFKQIGNGWPVPMAEWAGSEIVRYFKSEAAA